MNEFTAGRKNFKNQCYVLFIDFTLRHDRKNSDLVIPLIKKVYENTDAENSDIVYLYAYILHLNNKQKEAVDIAQKLFKLCSNEAEKKEVDVFISQISSSVTDKK